jgi:energy-coupling factor transporter ATP-binding protein EcfA2
MPDQVRHDMWINHFFTIMTQPEYAGIKNVINAKRQNHLLESIMDESFQRFTKYFNTYEIREEAFRKSVFSLIPRKYSGPKLFWKDFKRIAIDDLLQLVEQPIAYITSNPRDCLAFGTPWQVLSAARLCAQNQKKGNVSSVEDVAEDFGVSENLYQPIRTLSGGETVKLALAKAFLFASFSQRLTIASPFSWLSRENGLYFEKLYTYYIKAGIPLELLALDGEDSTEAYKISETQPEIFSPPVDFSIVFKEVTIPLGSSLNPLQSQDAYAEVDDLEHGLQSPCLIVGENGQGKTLIAKALTGAISIQGAAEIIPKQKAGPARLLFQDVITQTLLRSFDGIAASASGMSAENPLKLYDEIFQAYALNLLDIDHTSAGFELSAKAEFRSLLEIKVLLVAVRLCGRPSALILDEPDWGLNRDSAIAFVLAIIKVAHGLHTPVLVISHKPWWFNIAKSRIHVKRTGKEMDKDQNYSFQIKLKCAAA